MNVLVLCTGNSARSILLESILNRYGGEKITAFSAGSDPTGTVHPQSLKLLEEKGCDLSNVRSKSWDEFSVPDAPNLDVAITVCDNAASEPCPYWPGGPVQAHWGVPDPVAAEKQDWNQVFSETYDVLEKRALAYLSLPIADMEASSLKSELQKIGEIE